MEFLKIASLFFVTALAEIVGCYLPWLVLKQGKSVWLLAPAVVSLALFAWLLTLHPTAAGRTYAAYGGAYICVALLWLRRRGAGFGGHDGNCTTAVAVIISTLRKG
jgi:small multidrug resistance family-3 protein